MILNNDATMLIWTRSTLVEFGVDINGAKKPNTLGKDIFYLILTKQDITSSVYGKNIKKGSFVFYGQGYDRTYLKTKGYACTKSSGTSRGTYCGALIFLDGWQIAKDYPW